MQTPPCPEVGVSVRATVGVRVKVKGRPRKVRGMPLMQGCVGCGRCRGAWDAVDAGVRGMPLDAGVRGMRSILVVDPNLLNAPSLYAPSLLFICTMNLRVNRGLPSTWVGRS